MATRKPSYRLNRTRLTVLPLHAPPDDLQYWRTRTPLERLQYMEYLRQINYGKKALSGRLKRVLEVAQRKAR